MSEMSNDELRLAIAKAKYTLVEIRLCSKDPECGDWSEIQSLDLMGNDANPCYQLQPCYGENNGENMWWEVCPNWPTNITAAWELFEELRQNMFRVQLSIWNNKPIWLAQAFYRQEHDEHKHFLNGRGDTASQAICMLWLSWKGGNNE